MRRARRRAGTGRRGPTLIEVGHLSLRAPTRPPTTRPPTSTRSGVEEARAHECLGRYEAYLRRQGVLDDAFVERVKNEAAEAMREGIAAAGPSPPADPELIFEYAYAEPPAGLREGWLG